MTWYANCQGIYQGNFICCSFRQKVEIQVCKNKIIKMVKLGVKTMPILGLNKKDEKLLLQATKRYIQKQ